MTMLEFVLSDFRNSTQKTEVSFDGAGGITITRGPSSYTGDCLPNDEALLNAMVYFRALRIKDEN